MNFFKKVHKKRRKLNRKKAVINSDKLRRNQTKHEDIFRELLIKHHFKFEIQKPFSGLHGCYIVDFYFPRKFNRDLVVELDGVNHRSKRAIGYDKRRTAFLEKKKLIVIRYNNEDVLIKPEEIIEELKLKYRCTCYITDRVGYIKQLK